MHKAKLTISRPSYGDGKKKIAISVHDVDAGIEFLEIEIDYDNFAECLTGLSMVECEMQVRGLQNVGKQIERKTIEFELGGKIYSSDLKERASKIAKEVCDEGWHPSTYFGSQSSFFEKDGKLYARTTASRWVEKQ